MRKTNKMQLTSYPATKQMVSWLYLDGNLYKATGKLIPIARFYQSRNEFYPYVYSIMN